MRVRLRLLRGRVPLRWRSGWWAAGAAVARTVVASARGTHGEEPTVCTFAKIAGSEDAPFDKLGPSLSQFGLAPAINASGTVAFDAALGFAPVTSACSPAAAAWWR